jgi:hypothetical protein
MRDQFEITGFFYEINGFKFRKYLNIIKISSTRIKPDMMVVMMNPGSSRPVDGIDNNITESIAVPDNTQDQIMRVMLNCNFEFARILNLSDLREPKSNTFYSKIDELKENGIPHSIFDDKRENDFNDCFVSDIPIICAWGVNKKLMELAKSAINKTGKQKPIGIKKEGTKYAYYHPLPRINEKQKEWVKKITQLVNDTK